MGRFFRFMLGVAALPFAWSLARVFVDVVQQVPGRDALLPPGLVAMFVGMAVYVATAILLPTPVRVYVLGHELTHALCGLLFGARVSNLKVGVRGGSVMVSKSNVWITLSPYFVPFYTVVVTIAAIVVRCCAGHLPYPPAWFFAVGFTWSFHFVFTVRSLLQEQPDVQEYGYVFSYVLIWIFNVAGAAVWIGCMADVPWKFLGADVFNRACQSYSAVAACCVSLYEHLRSLSFLQG